VPDPWIAGDLIPEVAPHQKTYDSIVNRSSAAAYRTLLGKSEIAPDLNGTRRGRMRSPFTMTGLGYCASAVRRLHAGAVSCPIEAIRKGLISWL
jgi:hypothetical protein